MLGIGASEGLIIVLIAVLLFGAPALTFMMGYILGKKKAQSNAGNDIVPAQSDTHKEIAEDE